MQIRSVSGIRAHVQANATALNALCWNEATLNVALEAALTDCSAALDKVPKFAAALDSKGFVLLRLGRFKDSVAAYDAAIELRPKQAESLWGRGLAKIRLGQTTDGEADLTAARTVSADVETEFAGYGVVR